MNEKTVISCLSVLVLNLGKSTKFSDCIANCLVGYAIKIEQENQRLISKYEVNA